MRLAALDYNGPDVEREFRGYNKYLAPVGPPANPFTPRPLRGIYHLGVCAGWGRANITQIQGAATVENLMQKIYCSTYAECMGRKPAAFAVLRGDRAPDSGVPVQSTHRLRGVAR
jgi:hypothetical protein